MLVFPINDYLLSPLTRYLLNSHTRFLFLPGLFTGPVKTAGLVPAIKISKEF